MTCFECGADAAESARFCPRCGAPITAGKKLATPTPAGQLPGLAPPQPTITVPTTSATTGASEPRDHRPVPWVVIAVVAALIVAIAGIAYGIIASQDFQQSVPKRHARPPTRHIPNTSTTVPSTEPPGTTFAPQPVPTTVGPVMLTADMHTWAHDRYKCGPDPTPTGLPFSSTQTYEITGTIHLWSAPSTGSTPLATVNAVNGPGGPGCPSGSGPMATVQCKTTGMPVTGPFSTDTIWERVRWSGLVGFVSDEWINTQWDTTTFPQCG